MTSSVDLDRLEKIKAEIGPLIDAYLDSHPEVVEQYTKALATAPAAPAPPAAPVAPAPAKNAAKPEKAAEGKVDVEALVTDEAAADTSLVEELVAAELKKAGDADLGVQDVDDDFDDEDEEPEQDADLETLNAILSADDEPTAKQLAAIRSAGYSIGYTDDPI